MKALQHNPSLCKSVITSFVNCLQNDTSFVSDSALALLPEFVLLAQGLFFASNGINSVLTFYYLPPPDYRYLILRKVLEMAISGNTNALTALVDGFKSLHSQIGC